MRNCDSATLGMKKKRIQNISFIVIFILTSSFLHFKDINKLPTSTHAWAQSDHYALALGFHNDGFNFFLPTTFALDVQFPAKEKLEYPSGITAVDFPILHYTVALLMKALGTTAPWVFRLTMLLLSFLALFSLFKTLCSLKGTAIATIVVSFIMFQPIYCFYQDGFHVSAAAYNMFLIGLSFAIRYFHNEKHRYIIFSILFLTLASLMRFTHLISLLALGGSYFIISINKKSIHKNLYYIAGGVGIVLSYFIYNRILASQYGSIILGKAMPPHSASEAIFYLKRIIATYSRGFLPLIHLTMLILTVLAFWKYGKKRQNLMENPVLLWAGISFIGTAMFSVLMMWGLSAHDYYSLDTWLPFITIAMCYLLLNTDFSRIDKETIMVATSLFAVAVFSLATELQLKKYSENINLGNTDIIIQDFSHSSKWLNEAIPKDSKTLIICPNGWNTPMIGWQRKAYRIHNINAQTLERLNNESYDYIVVHNASISNEESDQIQSYCKLIQSNNQLSIYQQQ